MQRVFALVDREPAAGYLVREHARTGADVNEGTRTKPRQFVRYGPTLSAEGFEVDVDTKASEVSVRALDASVVLGSASVVVGPQRGATVRQRCHARALRTSTISRARLPARARCCERSSRTPRTGAADCQN